MVRPLPCVTRVAGSNPGAVEIFDFDFLFNFSIKIDSSIFLKENSVWDFSASFELKWQQQSILEAALKSTTTLASFSLAQKARFANTIFIF